MLSGRRLDLLDPSPVDIEISDIAHGLARVARWNGQTYGEHAFSVAQHSLVVEALCDHPGINAVTFVGSPPTVACVHGNPLAPDAPYAIGVGFGSI